MKLTSISLAIYFLFNGSDLYEIKPFAVSKYVGEA